MAKRLSLFTVSSSADRAIRATHRDAIMAQRDATPKPLAYAGGYLFRMMNIGIRIALLHMSSKEDADMKTKLRAVSLLSVLFFGMFGHFGHAVDLSGHSHLKHRSGRKHHHGAAHCLQ